jgi:acetyltransferase-like isoleucine patch superfamily enzyme
MGAVVINDVPDGAVVVGNPARVLGRRDAVVASDAARSLDV